MLNDPQWCASTAKHCRLINYQNYGPIWVYTKSPVTEYCNASETSYACTKLISQHISESNSVHSCNLYNIIATKIVNDMLQMWSVSNVMFTNQVFCQCFPNKKMFSYDWWLSDTAVRINYVQLLGMNSTISTKAYTLNRCLFNSTTCSPWEWVPQHQLNHTLWLGVYLKMFVESNSKQHIL